MHEFIYYSSVIVLTCLALFVLCILVRENDRVDKKTKNLFYLTYILIAASALAEWVGVRLDGDADFPTALLRAVKCADYILTPATGVALSMQLGLSSIWQKMQAVVAAGNAVFQLIACFFGWTLVIDGATHKYSHGPLYSVYIAVYVAIIVLVLIQFALYGRSFRKQNRASLFLVILLVMAGIFIQETVGVRVSYIALALGAALLYIHLNEFSQLTTDDVVTRQQAEITTDVLTGLHSRYAYVKQLEMYDDVGVPEDLAVFMIDINGLKIVNDTLGHEAGDELIKGAASCISSTFEEAYRIGGDEFLAIAHMTREEADAALAKLKECSNSWHGSLVDKMSVSAGYALASDWPDAHAEDLAREADREMYEEKTQYYKEHGLSRRGL